MERIYDVIGLSEEDELLDERTQFNKVFRTSDKKVNRLISYGNPIHHFSPSGYGLNPSKDDWEDIDIQLNLLDEPDKSYGSHFLVSSNIFTVGFRNDKSLDKYMGVRYKYGGDESQIEVTPLEININNKNILSNEFSNITTSANRFILHHIDDDNYLRTDLNNFIIRPILITNEWLYDVFLKYRFDIKGFTVRNRLSGNRYLPDERNRFYITSDDNERLSFFINQPMICDKDTNQSTGLHHSLSIVDDCLIYTKSLTDGGIDWVVARQPPYFIDASLTMSSNGAKDGIITESNNTSWQTAHEEGVGDSAVTNQGIGYATVAFKSSHTESKGTHTYGIYRVFLYFNTSTLQSYDTVTACTMEVFGHTNEDTNAVAQEGLQADTLATDDYDAFVSGAGENLSGAALIDGSVIWHLITYNKFTFNSTGVNSIKHDGSSWTKICVREWDYDYNDNEPAQGNTYNNGMFFGEAASNRWPYMDITYTPGTPPVVTGPTDCDNPGDIAINTTNYGDEMYAQVTNYGDELRQYSTCS